MKTNRWGSMRPARVGRLVAAGAALGAMSVPALGALPASASHAKIKIATMTTSKGTVLESKGKTVYTLVPSSTPCTTACFKIWPPVMLSSGQTQPLAGQGVQKSQLGSVHVKGGRQATFEGHRLYWFVGDKGPGQVNGNFTDTWGKWIAATAMAPAASTGSASSAPATTAPATSAPATTAPASSGSGSSSSGSGSSSSGSGSSNSNSGSGGASF